MEERGTKTWKIDIWPSLDEVEVKKNLTSTHKKNCLYIKSFMQEKPSKSLKLL